MALYIVRVNTQPQDVVSASVDTVPRNRGGGSKPHPVTKALREGLRDLCHYRALATIEGILDDPEAKPADRLKAIELCLSHAIGRPRQSIELGVRGISLIDDIATMGGEDDGGSNGDGGDA